MTLLAIETEKDLHLMGDTYIKVNDALPEHRKIVAAGGDAAWLHICAIAYCSRNLTDGRVPMGVVARLSDRKRPDTLAAKLTEVRLWHTAGHDCDRCPQPGPDEYLIHDYLNHQRSAAHIDAIKEKRATAGRVGGSRKAANAGRSKQKAGAKETPSNLLDGWHDGVEANGTPVSEEVLRTSRAEADTDVPPTAAGAATTPKLVLVAADSAATAQTILGDYLDWCRKRPPKQVIGQLGKLIAGMLGDDIDADDIKRGMAAWHAKGLHPSTLPSVVNEVMNSPTPGAARSTTDDRVAQAQALKAAFAGQSGADSPPPNTVPGEVIR